VLLAMGFVHPTPEGMLEDLNVDLDGRGNVLANTENYELNNTLIRFSWFLASLHCLYSFGNTN